MRWSRAVTVLALVVATAGCTEDGRRALDDDSGNAHSTSSPDDVPGDADSPYAWTWDSLPEGHQVVVVPDMTAEEALRILRPVRPASSPDEFERVVVGELDGGVVLFTSWFVADQHVLALSRDGGLAASYSNTINGDDHVLVARDGEVVRSFDPFLAYNYVETKPLPEEEGLDFREDTWPASWTLLERLTGIHISQDWLLDESHPAYHLKD